MKQVLKEFKSRNVQEVLSRQGDFTISYEIELASKEQMRPEHVQNLHNIVDTPQSKAKKEAYFKSKEEKEYLILNLFRIEPSKLSDSKHLASMLFMRVLKDDIETEEVKELILNVAMDITGTDYVKDFFRAFEIDDTDSMVDIVHECLTEIGFFLEEVMLAPPNIEELLSTIASTIASSETQDEARWVLSKLNKYLSVQITERVGEIEGRTIFVSGADDTYKYKSIQDPVFIAYLQHFLPNFMTKWESQLKIEIEHSFQRGMGVEFSMKKYLNGLDQSFEFLDDLYAELNAQDFFFMKEDLTGLHINIGTITGQPYNLMKGFLYLDEEQKDGGSMARKGLSDSRVFTRWAESVKDVAHLKILETIEILIEEEPELWYQGVVQDFKKSLLNPKGDLSSIEKILSNAVFGAALNKGAKNLGFNVLYVKGRDGDANISYVEFRYPGGQIDIQTMKELTLYYCYLVLLMTDPLFHKNEYLSKLLGFINVTASRKIAVVEKKHKLFRPGMAFYVGHSFNMGLFQDDGSELQIRFAKNVDSYSGNRTPINIASVYSLVDILSVDEDENEDYREIDRVNATESSHMMDDQSYVPVMIKIKDVVDDEYIVSFLYVDSSLNVKEFEKAMSSNEILGHIYIPLNDEIFETNNLVTSYKISKSIAQTYQFYLDETRKGIRFAFDIEDVKVGFNDDEELKKVKTQIITLVQARDKGTISHAEMKMGIQRLANQNPEAHEKYKALFSSLLGNQDERY